MQDIILLTDRSSCELAERIFDRLRNEYNDNRWDLATVEYTQFANREFKPKIPRTIRHMDVFYLHDFNEPDVNSGLIKLMLTLDAVSRADVTSTTLVLPFIPYGRQDRKDDSRVPISARMVANMIELYPTVQRIQTLDMHSKQAQGFYKIPVDDLYGRIVFSQRFREQYMGRFQDLIVYSPDTGGLKRARNFAESIDSLVDCFETNKERPSDNQVKIVRFYGDPKNRDVVIFDDMIDTGGSMIEVGKAALSRGANSVTAVASHGLFSTKNGQPPAEQLFRESGMKVIVTESVQRSDVYKKENKDWLEIVPLDHLFAITMHESSIGGGSISKLFKEGMTHGLYQA